jgi:transcriptional regulator with XRE-family HTH domain
MKVGSIGEYIRQQREQAKISMRQLASAAGVSNPYLSQIERGLRRPSAEILQQIAKGLRISAEALYVQAGILEDRQSESGVRTAVLADPGLSERQKQVLLEIYESFRKEMAASEEDAAAAEGSEPGDLATDGAAADGQAPDGSTPNGSSPDGVALGGATLGGAELNGAAHANTWADAVEPDAAGPDPAE